MSDTERRIILVGKMGNGKSSTGNTLLGRTAFRTNFSLTSVTQRTHLKYIYRTNNVRFVVVDTPGLMDPEIKLGDRLLEVQRAVEICPEPHAFLIIFSPECRITTDEKFTIDLLRIAFGEDIFHNCIVVYTHGGRFHTDQEFDQFWRGSEIMKKLVEKCGGRITRIENESPVDLEDNESVNKINEMIEAMTDGGRKTYRYFWIGTHRRVLQEHVEKYNGTGDLHVELSVLAHSLGRVLDKDIWEVMLVGATCLAVGAAGVGAVGYGAYVAGTAVVGMATSGTIGSAIAAAGSAIAAKAIWFVSKIRK